MCALPSPVVAGCTFCSIVEGTSPSQTIYEDDNAMAFMDLLPMTPGHCLIVPKRHVVDVWDLDDEDAAHVMQACRKVAHLVRERLEPLGINLLNNNGAHADQSQFHFHVHLIPRYGRDRLLHPWERTFGHPDQIRTVAEVIRSERDRDDLFG